MRTPTRMFTALGVLFLFSSSLSACAEESHPLAENLVQELRVAEAPSNAPVTDPLTVMTRNLYHGGDIGPVLQVGFGDLKLLAETAAGVWAEVQANNFTERAVAIVDEIEATRPDVIGLQEFARFLTLGLNPSTQLYEPTGIIDFEQILGAELAGRGLGYSFVAVQDNTQVSVPVAGVEMGGQFIPTQLVQLTVRDAVLVRDGLEVVDWEKNNYEARVPLGNDPFGNPIQLLRGWVRVDLDIDGVPYHFVNTHLEIQSFAPFQIQQTRELLSEVVNELDGVTIMTGDFNSDAASGPGAPSWTESYGMIRAAGFQDTWAMAHPGKAKAGLTCCQASDLRNPLSQFYQRIDFVFVRTAATNPEGHMAGAVTAQLVGADASDMAAPNGLWPSDHAGLVANIWFAPGQLNHMR